MKDNRFRPLRADLRRRVGKLGNARINGLLRAAPAKQQVVIQLLHQQALAANGLEDLRQLSAQQPLRWDRGSADRGIEPIELARHVAQHLVDQSADGAQRMVRLMHDRQCVLSRRYLSNIPSDKKRSYQFDLVSILRKRRVMRPDGLDAYQSRTDSYSVRSRWRQTRRVLPRRPVRDGQSSRRSVPL